MADKKVIAKFTLSEEEHAGEPAGIGREVTIVMLPNEETNKPREEPNAALFKTLAEHDRRVWEENLVFDPVTGEQIIINPNGKKGAKMVIESRIIED